MGRKGSGSGLSGFRLLTVTFKQLLQKKQVLLLPITMFIGAEQAFMAVGFTAVSNNFPPFQPLLLGMKTILIFK